MVAILSLPTLDELFAHVHKTLCDKNFLDPIQSPLRRMVINRRGRPCGMFFEVAGTRLMRSYAVWAGEENRILFYDNSGERFAEVRLSDAPNPLQVEAA
jgi:hypothetical protein